MDRHCAKEDIQVDRKAVWVVDKEILSGKISVLKDAQHFQLSKNCKFKISKKKSKKQKTSVRSPESSQLLVKILIVQLLYKIELSYEVSHTTLQL